MAPAADRPRSLREPHGIGLRLSPSCEGDSRVQHIERGAGHTAGPSACHPGVSFDAVMTRSGAWVSIAQVLEESAGVMQAG
jgi:hypothetical protein